MCWSSHEKERLLEELAERRDTELPRVADEPEADGPEVAPVEHEERELVHS